MSPLTPGWNPAGHAVHRLVQYLDVMAVAAGQYAIRRRGIPAPGPDPDDRAEYARRTAALAEEHAAVWRALVPAAGPAVPNRTIERWVDEAARELARRPGPADPAPLDVAKQWLSDTELGFLRPGAAVPDTLRPYTAWPAGDRRPGYEDVRGGLLRLLALAGEVVPQAIHDRGRVAFAMTDPADPPVPVAELCRWVTAAGPPAGGGGNPTGALLEAGGRKLLDLSRCPGCGHPTDTAAAAYRYRYTCAGCGRWQIHSNAGVVRHPSGRTVTVTTGEGGTRLWWQPVEASPATAARPQVVLGAADPGDAATDRPAPGTGPPPDPLAGVAADQDRIRARRACEERGQAVGRRRAAIWAERLARPVCAAAGGWRAGWEALGCGLLSGDAEAAAVALRGLSGRLAEFQRLWDDGRAADAEWFEREGEPYNAEAATFELGAFARRPSMALYQPLTDAAEWAAHLPWHGGGPAAVPRAVTGHHLFEQALRTPEFEELWCDLRVVYDALTHPDGVGPLLGRLFQPRRLAALVLPLAATVLPAPDLIPAFLAAHPAAEAVQNARQLFHVTPDAIRTRTLPVLDRLLADQSAAAEALHKMTTVLPTGANVGDVRVGEPAAGGAGGRRTGPPDGDESDGPTAPPAEVVLTDRQENILIEMSALGAAGRRSRTTREAVVNRLGGRGHTVANCARDFGRLKEVGYTDSEVGPDGGVWLTIRGAAAAERLRG